MTPEPTLCLIAGFVVADLLAWWFGVRPARAEAERLWDERNAAVNLAAYRGRQLDAASAAAARRCEVYDASLATREAERDAARAKSATAEEACWEAQEEAVQLQVALKDARALVAEREAQCRAASEALRAREAELEEFRDAAASWHQHYEAAQRELADVRRRLARPKKRGGRRGEAA